MKKKIALLGGLGVAGGLLYAFGFRSRKNKDSDQPDVAENDSAGAANGQSVSGAQNGGRRPQPAAAVASENEHIIDDQGTDQAEASQILKHIRDNAFDASDEKLALALGRPTEEIEEWTRGDGLIDGDVILKARTLAMQRGFQL